MICNIGGDTFLLFLLFNIVHIAIEKLESDHSETKQRCFLRSVEHRRPGHQAARQYLLIKWYFDTHLVFNRSESAIWVFRLNCAALTRSSNIVYMFKPACHKVSHSNPDVKLQYRG